LVDRDGKRAIIVQASGERQGARLLDVRDDRDAVAIGDRAGDERIVTFDRCSIWACPKGSATIVVSVAWSILARFR
jgi:hypothetical protein